VEPAHRSAERERPRHGILQSQLGERLGGLALVAATTAAVGLRRAGPLWPVEWPIAWQVALGIVVADGLDYWKHPLAPHRRRAGDSTRSITASRGSMRFGRREAISEKSRFGSPSSTRRSSRSARRARCSSGTRAHRHARRDRPFERAAPSAVVAHRLLMTPHVHRLHHAQERALSDSNYANILPLWDVRLRDRSAIPTRTGCAASARPTMRCRELPAPGRPAVRAAPALTRPRRGGKPIDADGAARPLRRATVAATSRRPAPQPDAIVDLGRRLPPDVRLGTSSWSFPGGAPLVWDREATPGALARGGLARTPRIRSSERSASIARTTARCRARRWRRSRRRRRRRSASS
jgi:hypothetical protein